MREPYETIEANGRIASIYLDDNPMLLREWRDAADTSQPTIYYVSNHYTLGHEQLDSDTLREMARDRAVYSLPVYAYLHGGETISLGRFACPWDSGQSGIVAVDKAAFAAAIGHRRWNGATAKRAREAFLGVVTKFDQYLTGDVWGYRIEGEDGETLDSCWGFYGHGCILDEVRAALEAMRPPAPPMEELLEGMAANVA